MTKEQIENFKNRMAKMRINQANVMENRAILQSEYGALSKRCVKFEGEENSRQIYEDWLKKYNEKKPGFNEEENNFRMDVNKYGLISFNDPQAEEDFVRYLAAHKSHGGILDKGILIAKYENGKLIDPRTNQEFRKGEYAELVQKLDSGIKYSDISYPKSIAPNPFSTRLVS
ncbi:MAG: hypothetical protein BGO90_07270 [Legionella sp. 40-6]|nr:hypothetical protein [Legionella sp.]OJX90919.1 MAG: hypothetical protein BGO90_07270 [Legionella sp. 40-6]